MLNYHTLDQIFLNVSQIKVTSKFWCKFIFGLFNCISSFILILRRKESGLVGVGVIQLLLSICHYFPFNYLSACQDRIEKLYKGIWLDTALSSWFIFSIFFHYLIKKNKPNSVYIAPGLKATEIECLNRYYN